MALAKYIGRKVAWTLVVFIVALLLNFLLPRLIPGNPVDAIVGQLAQGGGAGGEQLQQIHELSCVPVRSSWGNASKGAFHDGPSTTVYLR
jgi:ABC-type dipeptide/oligopeptide/nickel transport system permease component